MSVFDGGDPQSFVGGLSDQMVKLNGLTDQFGKTLASSMARGIAQGKGFDDILRGLGQRLLELSLKQAFKPLETGLSGLLSGLTKGLGNLFGGGQGVGNAVTPFAEGGVVNAPQYFQMGRGFGLAGERGAEAILPLARGPDGRLGVAGGGGGSVNVQMTVTTPDAESFRRAEAQVGAALARAVARGQRNL